MILASASPRRKEILSLLTTDFQVIPAMGEEKIQGDYPPKVLVEKLAYQKADEVFQKYPHELVIGSDTVVEINGEILGKPLDEGDAFRQLSTLSGQLHYVHTGVAILSPNHKHHFTVSSGVQFAPLTPEEIRWYIDTKEPMDKAGSYAIQGLGGRFITRIQEGDYYAIMGLPLQSVYRLLKEYL